MFKTKKLIALVAYTPSSIILNETTKQYYYGKEISPQFVRYGEEAQHLHILSDEKIETDMWSKYPVGTWFYSNIRGDVSQLQPKELGYDPSGWIVEATTDKTLGIALIPETLAELFVKNEGQISEVKVQYINALVGWTDEEDEDGRYQNPVYEDIMVINDDNYIVIEE